MGTRIGQFIFVDQQSATHIEFPLETRYSGVHEVDTNTVNLEFDPIPERRDRIGGGDRFVVDRQPEGLGLVRAVRFVIDPSEISAGRAAELLGVDRWQLGELMSAHGVSPFDETMTREELEQEVTETVEALEAAGRPSLRA